jgi:hypothetical protein
VLLGAAVLLVGLGVELLELTIAGAAAGVVGICLWSFDRFRTARLARAVDAALAKTADRSELFFALTESFEAAWPQAYSMLVAWHGDGTDGTIELARGASGVPDAELTSWLLREAESSRDLIVDDGGELGREGASLALPLRRENSALVGFLVLGGEGHPPAHLLAAARSRLDPIGLALADAPTVSLDRRLAAVGG